MYLGDCGVMGLFVDRVVRGRGGYIGIFVFYIVWFIVWVGLFMIKVLWVLVRLVNGIIVVCIKFGLFGYKVYWLIGVVGF